MGERNRARVGNKKQESKERKPRSGNEGKWQSEKNGSTEIGRRGYKALDRGGKRERVKVEKKKNQ